MTNSTTHSSLVDVSEADFAAEVEQSPLPVFVDFWAQGCAPCIALTPVLEALAKDYGGQIKFVKAKLDDYTHAGKLRLGIRGVPYLMLFRDGQIVERVSGSRHKAYFSGLLDKYVQRPVAAAKPAAGAFRAFHGDAGLRGQVVERVRAHVEAGRIVAHGYSGPISDADQQRYSLMGAAAETADLRRFEDALGIPASVGRLQEVVHSLLLEPVGESGERGFRPPRNTRPLDWWRAIPPGADLQGLPSRFIDWLLRDLVGHTDRYGIDLSVAERAALESVAQLHGRLAQGEVPAAEEWQSVRDAIAARLQSLPENLEERAVRFLRAVLECAEELAWPADQLDDTPTKAVGQLLYVTSRATPPAGYTPERWAERDRLVIEASRRIQKAFLERYEASAQPSAATPEQEKEQFRRINEEVSALEEIKAANALIEQVILVREAHLAKVSLSFGEHLHAGLMQALSATVSSNP